MVPEGWEVTRYEADLWAAQYERDGRRASLRVFWWYAVWTWDFRYADAAEHGEWHGTAPTKAEAISAARARAAKEGLSDDTGG